MCCPDVHRSTTTIEVYYSLNTFVFAMDNLQLDLNGNINHYAKTNFFHTRGKAAIMYLTHMRAYNGLIGPQISNLNPNLT